MTIYLAGPWDAKPAVRAARQQFENAGITVLATWIDHHGSADDDTRELSRQAYIDLHQINKAEVFVVLAIPGLKSEGKASEFMYAYTRDKRTLVVGDHTQNIFYHLAGVELYKTVEEAIIALHTPRYEETVSDLSAHGW